MSAGPAMDDEMIVVAVAAAALQIRESARALVGITAQVRDQAGHASAIARRSSDDALATATSARVMAASAGGFAAAIHQQESAVDAARASAGAGSRAMGSLAQSAISIDDMVNVIGRIAAQTRMLSLNARIEAARAGDAGRSFSVVAEEVKLLSARTSEATGAIGAIIGAVRGEVDRTSALIDDSLARFGEARDLAKQVAAASDQQRAIADDVQSHAGGAAANADAATLIIGKLATAATASDIIAEQILAAVETLIEVLGTLPAARAGMKTLAA